MQKQSRFILIIIGVIVFGGALFGAYLEQVEKQEPQPVQTATASSVPASEPVDTMPADPYQRIVAIVDKYGEFPTITNLKNINAKNPESPYEVIVVMDHVKSCFSAKEKAQHIMRDLYHDPVVGPTLLRVKAINNEYVSASLGKDGAKIMHETFWTGGPTNFFKALQSATNYDMDDVQEATSRTAGTYTYAELEPDCQ